MIRLRVSLLAMCLALLASAPMLASDPPHNGVIECKTCHTLHGAPGAVLTAVAGNANLCMSCHLPGGTASGKPFVTGDQALPGQGLPAGTNATGISHRWDSGPAGHLVKEVPNANTGKITLSGAYAGAYPTTIQIKISSQGQVGTARFDWQMTVNGTSTWSTPATTGVFTSTTPVALGTTGISVAFANGTATPSFVLNDIYLIYARAETRAPVTAALNQRLENGQFMCSTCHDQHSQASKPFDPAAPASYTPGVTNNRHFQRIANDADQMCVDCHSSRDVTASTGGSHPVNVAIPLGAYKAPATLPLDATANRVRCETCHKIHYAPTNDGTLTRASNNALCLDCHTLADTTTPARHLSPTLGVLWPGGQYGSTFPAKTDTVLRGACSNCHQPHGWPDSSNTAVKYPNLLVDKEEKLCFTCHDGSPVTKNVQAEFSKPSKHNVASYSGIHSSSEAAVTTAQHVECADCHNSHMSAVSAGAPPAGMTSPRAALGALKGTRGVTASNAEINPADFEYQICFRCHADSTNKPAPKTPRLFAQGNVRLEFAGSYPSYHAVAAPSKAGTTSLVSGWTNTSYLACTSCHNNNAGPGNGGTGPNGPHGSTNTTLLERRYTTDSTTTPGYVTYASGANGTAGLCWKCHSETTIYSGSGGAFKEHNKHINGEKASCNLCHDPHASSGYKRLINFDTRYVTKYGANTAPIWNSATRSCTLTCHGQDHNDWNY